MVTVELQLQSGSKATFFLSRTQNFVVTPIVTGTGCILVDNTHNNGGWKLVKSADEVIAIIRKAFKEGYDL